MYYVHTYLHTYYVYTYVCLYMYKCACMDVCIYYICMYMCLCSMYVCMLMHNSEIIVSVCFYVYMYNYVSDNFFLIDKIIHANNQRINSLSNQEEFIL